MESTKQELRDFILNEFLPGERPEELTDSTPLITGGILDSLATLKLVAFLEERYGVEVEAYELSADYMDTVSSIATLVHSKMPSMASA